MRTVVTVRIWTDGSLVSMSLPVCCSSQPLKSSKLCNELERLKNGTPKIVFKTYEEDVLTVIKTKR